MAEKLTTLNQIKRLKRYIDENDNTALKSVESTDNTLKFYASTDKSGSPIATLKLPEEFFLDQSKTAFVKKFSWSSTAYPNSTDPKLDGKPVLILAVHSDTMTNYSFVLIDAAVDVIGGDTTTAAVTVNDGEIKPYVKVSAREGNALTVESDGLYVENTSGNEDIVGISSITQTATSHISSGENIVTIAKTDGTSTNFSVHNGEKGDKGNTGDKGDKGDAGEKGDKGDKGDTGEKGDAGVAGTDGIGISSVTQTLSSKASSGKNIITITKTDGTSSDFTVYNGAQGEKGEKGDMGNAGTNGVGISSITQTLSSQDSSGKNIITVTKTDDSSSSFTVYNGAQGATGGKGEKGDKGDAGDTGADGVGISSVTQTLSSQTSGGKNVITIAKTDGTSSDFTVYNGAQGVKGDKGDKGEKGDTGDAGVDGIGISSIAQTTVSQASGGENVITVTKTDGTSSTFTVYNGAQGERGEKGNKGEKGDTGATGAKGDKGDKGDSGVLNTSTLYITAGRLSGSVLGTRATAEGIRVTASNNYAHAEGSDTVASGDSSHAEGGGAKATGEKSHAEGSLTNASGKFSHAEGDQSTASGNYSHAEGGLTNASGLYSHAEGLTTTASGFYSHAEGQSTTALGMFSHAEGSNTWANAEASHAGGFLTTADALYQTVIGQNNSRNSTDGEYFIIGNGGESPSNCFRVNSSAVFGGTYNSSGADYAEYFEWLDGNPNNEDRRGLFVTLDGETIRPANQNDSFVLGIVSGMPSVVGDSYDDQWNGMYLSDIFGSPIFENAAIPTMKDENGNTIIEAHTEYRRKLNPDFDSSKTYIPRSKRKEWSAVGMTGKLIAVDDGTCVVNGWCTVGENGKGTHSDAPTHYRVMKRIDESHVKIIAF